VHYVGQAVDHRLRARSLGASRVDTPRGPHASDDHA
jgi:hypothetical protein